MATKVGSQVSMPCIASRQAHHSNPEATSPLGHYKRNLVIPFLDHIIMCIDQKCSPSAVILHHFSVLYQVSCVQKRLILRVQLPHMLLICPHQELLNSEMERWKLKYMNIPPEKRPSSPANKTKKSVTVIVSLMYLFCYRLHALSQ